MNIEPIQAGIARIKKVLEDYTDGWANEKARREIVDACNSIEWSCDNDYIAEKLIDIRIAADNLYSARKHNKFKQGSSSGVEVLRGNIQSLLQRIEDESKLLAQSGIIPNN